MNRTELIEDFRLVPFQPWWQEPGVFISAALLILVALAAFIFSRHLKNRAIPRTAPAPPPTDWESEFLERLSRLRARRSQLTAYELAIATTQLVREYFAHAMNWEAPCQTSREMLDRALAEASLSPVQRSEFRGFLALADRIKFGRYGADSPEEDQLLNQAEVLLRRANQGPVAGLSPRVASPPV